MNKSLFETFYADLYESSRIIDSRLQVFCRYVIASLTASNPGGVFTTVLNNLNAAYGTYYGNLQDRSLKIADRKGSTQSLNEIIRQFADTVRLKYNLIASVFPKGSPAYMQFFPEGLTLMSKLDRENILPVVTNFSNRATQYKAQLGGDPFANIFSAFVTGITNALSTQNTNKYEVQSASGALHTNRQPVENALMKTMYAVGNQFYPDTNACNAYYDFSLLYADHHSTGTTYNGTADPHANALCIDQDITILSTFILRNPNNIPLIYFMTHELNGPRTGAEITVNPETEHPAPFAEFGAPDGLFLYVKNTTDFQANWEVRIEG